MGNINWRIGASTTSSSGANPISGTYSQTGSSEITISENFPSNTVKQLVNSFVFGVSGNNSGNLQAIILLASQNMVVYTDNTNSPNATIPLTAGIPFEWNNSLIYANPWNGAVNGVYVTCNTSGLLQGSILKY